MNIIISNASDKPIYEQITTQIKALIMSGQLSEGDVLPSIRLLAKELRISVITTKRAYEELERDGYLPQPRGESAPALAGRPSRRRDRGAVPAAGVGGAGRKRLLCQ